MLHALALHKRVEAKGGRVTPTDPGLTTFQRLERPRLSLSIADRLEQAIVSGTFAGGSRLPSEQALADQFQVSRNVVREAFKVLEERGLIEILSGSGTFVRHPGPETTSDALQRYMRLTTGGASIRALFEARRILECANARLPAKGLTPKTSSAWQRAWHRCRIHKAPTRLGLGRTSSSTWASPRPLTILSYSCCWSRWCARFVE